MPTEAEYAERLRQARLTDLARVNAKIARLQERIRAAQLDIVDLENTKVEILDALRAARPTQEP